MTNNHVKRIIKRSIQCAAAKFGPHRHRNSSPQLLVLTYHRILPEEDIRCQIEEPGMVVAPEILKIHLETLKQYFEMIHLSEWLIRKNNGQKLPDKACAITFDDGWSDNYEFAFPVLKSLNIPATIYLVSDMIGTADTFWPERLARLIHTIAHGYPQYWSHPELNWLQEDPKNYRFSKTPPSREELAILIACFKKYSDQDIHNRIMHMENFLQLSATDHLPSLLDWQQVSEMASSGLVEVGSHTCRHVRLTERVSKELLRSEIIESKEVIEKNSGQPVQTFCFPNGDFCPEALELVKQVYDGAVTTKSGWNTKHTDYHLLRRIGIHQDIASDKISFLARISGWI